MVYGGTDRTGRPHHEPGVWSLESAPRPLAGGVGTGEGARPVREVEGTEGRREADGTAEGVLGSRRHTPHHLDLVPSLPVDSGLDPVERTVSTNENPTLLRLRSTRPRSGRGGVHCTHVWEELVV